MSLDKIRKIEDLREIWKHEAKDFSKWLAEEENLRELSESINIDIVLEERESSVGEFSVDLLASEEGTGRKIIIENQLESTNHDHLGKIITYAAGKSADVVIWIVKKARDEHRQAIEWLNQHTDEKIGFFLIEIELWKIGNSLPAPRFNVVEKPNDWAKTLKVVAGLSDTKKLQYEFWQAFSEYAFDKDDFSKAFNRRKVQPQHWYSLSAGNSEYHIALTVNTQKSKIGVEIYINDNKEIFYKFFEKKEKIEEFIGVKLEWIEAKKACRILAVHEGDIKRDSQSWNNFFEWYCETSVKFKEMIKRFGN